MFRNFIALVTPTTFMWQSSSSHYFYSHCLMRVMMINRIIKFAAAITLTGVMGSANAAQYSDDLCKLMAASRDYMELLQKQGHCLNIKLDKSSPEVGNNRGTGSNAKPDLSKMGPVGPSERNCIITLTQNRPLSETPFCNQPESYYRDLMAGKVKSRELEKEAINNAKPSPYKDCIMKYREIYQNCGSLARKSTDANTTIGLLKKCDAAFENDTKACRKIHLGID